MPDLIAQGPEPRQRWRRRLPPDGSRVKVGREAGVWSIPWDLCISRQHVQLRWQEQRLHVVKIAESANPLFFQGNTVEACQLEIGQHFVLGQTRLSLADHNAEVSLDVERPADQRMFSAEDLRRASFQHAHSQVQALCRLPEIVAGAEQDDELYSRVIHLILTGIVGAQAAAVVDCRIGSSPTISVLHWDRLDSGAGTFQPSGRLIAEAVEQNKNVVHVWRRGQVVGPPEPNGIGRTPAYAADGGVSASDVAPGYTMQVDFDWAFCAPIPGTHCKGQAIYVAGGANEALDDDTLQDALKFVELVGTTVGNVCDVRRFQKQTTALAQFFSPPVRNAVAAGDPEVVLAPRQTEVSVLFCDLRGFSRRSEASADDLFDLLQRVSKALGIMTHEMLRFGGVIGDFHGDAAMGFWGWPMTDPACVAHACQTALSIQQAFEVAAEHGESALSGFRVGMGLATGPAVAGKIGTTDQVKVTAFGPVVNLASRLEGMTRQFGLPILIDEPTATRAIQQIVDNSASIRPVGRVRPYGLRTAHQLFTLVPSELGGGSTDLGAVYRQGYELFEAGNWPAARQHLQQLSDDATARFLLKWIDRLGPVAPADWNGVIELDGK